MLGSVAASSYSILCQIGFWVTLACEGISIATQSLIARHIDGDDDDEKRLVQRIVTRSVQGGLVTAGLLTMTLYICRRRVLSVFTKSANIQAVALDAFPWFLFAQCKLLFPRHARVKVLSTRGTLFLLSAPFFSRQGRSLSRQWYHHGREGLGSFHVVSSCRKCILLDHPTAKFPSPHAMDCMGILLLGTSISGLFAIQESHRSLEAAEK